MNIVCICFRIKAQVEKHLLGYSTFVLSTITFTSFLDSLLNITFTDMICQSHINPSDCLDVNAVHQVFLVLSLLWHELFP